MNVYCKKCKKHIHLVGDNLYSGDRFTCKGCQNSYIISFIPKCSFCDEPAEYEFTGWVEDGEGNGMFATNLICKDHKEEAEDWAGGNRDSDWNGFMSYSHVVMI